MRQALFLLTPWLLAASLCCAAETDSVLVWKRAPAQANLSYTLDNNITRALFASDQLADHVLGAELSDSVLVAEFEHARFALRAGVDVQHYLRHTQLDQLRASLEVAYQYRSSAEIDAPTYTLLARGNRLAARSYLREGHSLEAEASVRRLVTDRITLFGALAWQQRTAGSAVFSGDSRSLRANIDYRLGRSSTLYLGAELRRGALASTGLPALESLDIASVLVRDSAFPEAGYFAYRLAARSVAANLGVNLALGPGAIDMSWRHRHVLAPCQCAGRR